MDDDQKIEEFLSPPAYWRAVNAVDWGDDLNAVAAGVERLMELAKNQKGLSPHRDRMPATPDLVKAPSFHDDGTPKYVLAWFPLTDATTSNSCLYMWPAMYDPGYATGDDPTSNPLHVAMERKDPTAYQHIRALSSSSGCFTPFIFTPYHSLGHCNGPESRFA
eukprot:scaffold80393_cov53-Attheya_sp.AAC.1